MPRNPLCPAMAEALLLLVLGVGASTAADPPEIPKVSAFAPAEDLIAEVDFFLGRVDASLADADYDEAEQSRTLKDANTLAALALVLAVHDETHALKASAPAMVAAAQQLASAEGNYEQARAAHVKLKAARAGNAEAGEAPWKQVASLSALMKQVPLIHTALKRGVEPSRLTRGARQSAAQAAALAAIAQVSLLDSQYVKSPSDEQVWRASCIAMRDASGEVNSAVRSGDAARVADAMKRLTQSCDQCHAKFRDH